MDEKISLKEVWELQKIDAAIQSLEQDRERLPLELVLYKEALENGKKELEEMKKTFDNIQLERKAKEGEVSANEEIIKKHNIQLYSLKSNKEYTAMIKEIDDLKQKNKGLEDAVLELMEKSEQYKLVMKEKEKEVKTAEEVFKKEEEKNKNEIAKVEAHLALEKETREEQKKKVDPVLYQSYEKISQSKHGTGIVAIVDNSCGGCHINLPPQIINEVKMRKVIFCGSCARLLYWVGEENDGKE